MINSINISLVEFRSMDEKGCEYTQRELINVLLSISSGQIRCPTYFKSKETRRCEIYSYQNELEVNQWDFLFSRLKSIAQIICVS